MARRSASAPPKQSANLTLQQKQAAIPLLQRRIEELRKFDVNSISTLNDPRINVLSQAIDEALVRIFGSDTVDYERYMWAAHLRSGGMFLAGHGPSIRTVQQEVEEGRQKAIATLEGIIARFEEGIELTPPEPQPGPQPTRAGAESRKVFVVHGHDGEAREAVARFLVEIDLKPIILHEQPNQGRTIIEKVEDHSDVAFAVVLLTPDDVGGPKDGDQQPRPRQNVLLELGYFIGRLGRKRVCALKRGEMELPTDFAGVVWEPFDGTAGGWKQTLGRELQAAGFEIDWNKVMRHE